MTIVRCLLLTCLGINLLSASGVAAAAAIPAPVASPVVPGDVFSAIASLSPPIVAVSNNITADCPIMPAVSPRSPSPVAGACDASAANRIVPENVSRSAIHQAGGTPACRNIGSLQNAPNKVCFSSHPVCPFPPGGGFSDALRCYLVAIGVTALPSALSAVVMTVII